MSKKNLYGRRLLTREVEEERAWLPFVDHQMIDSVTVKKKELYCNRCGTSTRLNEAKISATFFYCPHCLFLGRCDSQQDLYLFEQPKEIPRIVKFEWSKTLTPLQKSISERLVQSHLKRHHFVWAVTGAGKTEMLYASVKQVLEQGGRVGIASPRLDVCNELFLRFRQVFPNESIRLLHGKRKEAYDYSTLVICTTHQLYRFYQAFDLLVIDEVDAFPFTGDSGLAYAVETALGSEGQLIYLSATPDDHLLQKVRGTFELHHLALRFHQRLLPEPINYFWNNWRKNCLHPRKNKTLIQLIHQLVKENHLLLFCPSIYLMNQLEQVLQQQLPFRITAASSKDNDRSQKVRRMRNQKYDIFLTTLILERGVTFERISVIVLGADHQVFTKSSLVQIAGRADRKGKFTNSKVYFLYEEKTKAIVKACQEIKQMNKKGKEQRCEMCLL